MRRPRLPLTLFEKFAQRCTDWTGGSMALGLAVAVVLGWLVSGPVFGYSDTWQLAINTSTTIVTFLMVFLIKRAQNKDSRAIQLKLNEVVAALQGASNQLINAEDMSEAEIKRLHDYYHRLAKLAESDHRPTESHSIEEAERRHRRKRERRMAKQPPTTVDCNEQA